MLVELLVIALTVVVATAFVWGGSSLLERAAENLSLYYGLPPVVHGAIVVAIGSSFPELASVVFAAIENDFNLGVSAIVGSAIFNVLVIPAISGLYGEGVGANRDIVYKEAQFYMVSVSALIITFALAVIYYPTGSDGQLLGQVTRELAVIPLLLYGVYVFTQYQDTSDYDSESPPADLSVLKEWLFLLVSLVVIAVAVEQLVEAALHLSDIFDTPSALWGITVIAAATSLPDTLVSVRAARRGDGVTSLANVFGSNIFDLLVVVPVGVLIFGTVDVDFSVVVPTMGFLTLATVVVFGLLRTELELTPRESGVLLVVYAGFVGWMVSETLGYTALVPGF
ncbi:sodium:calcium antiporter [Halomarina oriensis]|uniref:Sodium:calcium antiporter n=1 Tax=Halomarina oriensis TaxID=671145 RepID=A0A6B0GGE5_9EURY|nr:sodium:calcium antiporter [Halomarina oriensis]MWG34006.1 sodium:calcium antiporter [Halomarina oriensis]